MKITRFTSPSPTGGFTLVEVTIALAVVMIGLMAVLNMVANGLRSSRSAAENCVPAMIAQDVFNQIRTEYKTYGGLSFPTLPATPMPNLETFYSNIDGTPTNAAGAYYRTDVSYIDMPGVPATARPNIVRVLVEVYWPSAASPNYPNTNVFVSQVAKLW